MKKAALITVHGMGTTPENYNAELIEELKDRLGTKFDDLHVGSVYYQGILQPNEDRVWKKVSRRVKWDDLRKFLLFGFADAAGLETGKESLSSVYSLAQTSIARELYLARQAIGQTGPVIILAQSLGCQVVSCYFWDAQRARAGKDVSIGIWQNIKAFEIPIADIKSLTPEDILFLQGSSFRSFVTTGCNIPIFVAAHARTEILPIKPNDHFEWNNYYDRDDVLGWPLEDLSTEYAAVVKDHRVNAGSSVFGWLLKSWNPLSHGQYWGDDEVLDPLEDQLQKLLA